MGTSIFIYSADAVRQLETSLSEDRLSTYLEQTQRDTAEAIRLYVRNTRMSEAFYTPLQGLEVSVRNALHGQLQARLGADWYDNPACAFQFGQARKIDDAKNTLLNEGKPLTPSRIVAELSFGFWTGILGPKYENHLWRPHLRHAFPNAPKALLRKHVHAALDRIRRLRNRIMHHEPILARNLYEDHEQILAVIGWICSGTRKWVEHHSRFNCEYQP
jgi:hypothetical protein